MEPRNQQLKLKPINVHVGLLLPEASLEDQEVQSSHCIPPPGHRPPLDDRDVGARRPLPPPPPGARCIHTSLQARFHQLPSWAALGPEDRMEGPASRPQPQGLFYATLRAWPEHTSDYNSGHTSEEVFPTQNLPLPCARKPLFFNVGLSLKDRFCDPLVVVPAVRETLFCKMICPPYSSPPAGRWERQLHFPEAKPEPSPPRRHGEGHCGAGPRELLTDGGEPHRVPGRLMDAGGELQRSRFKSSLR